MPGAASAAGFSIQVFPTLDRHAKDRDLASAFKLYQLLRDYLLAGKRVREAGGQIDKAVAIKIAMAATGWTRRYVYDVLRQGRGIFWKEESRRHNGRGKPIKTLRLTGVMRLFDEWGVEPPRHVVLAPVELFRGAGNFNSLMFNGQMPDGPNTNPISHQALRAKTGVPERSQCRYKDLKLPGTCRKVTRQKGNRTLRRVDYPGKSQMYRLLETLPNSYESSLPRKGWGQGIADLKSSRCTRPSANLAKGPSRTARCYPRYFKTAKAALRANQKGLLAPNSMLRSRPPKGHSRYLGWWEPTGIEVGYAA